MIDITRTHFLAQARGLIGIALDIYAHSLEGFLFMASRPLLLLILGDMYFRLNRIRDKEYR